MKNTTNNSPEITCPYTKTKQKIKDFIQSITTELLNITWPQNLDDYEKITFKKWAKALWLHDISHKVPLIDSKQIDDFYNEVMAMSEQERGEYTKTFFTLEWYYSENHMKYSQIQWKFMEIIIQDVMNDMIIDTDWKKNLNIPEYNSDKWLEIWKDNEKFEESLLEYFKIKIYDSILEYAKSDKNTDEYKLFEIIFSTNKNYFLDLFMNKWIRNSISNFWYIVETALEWIYQCDEIIDFDKFEQCLLQNSNQLIIDLSRSARFLEELFITNKKHFYYNQKNNQVEFRLLNKNIDALWQVHKYPFNQYISCPMLFSKSNILWKQSNKILDFSKILMMCFIQFYKQAIPKQHKA